MNKFMIWYTGIFISYTILVENECQNVEVASASNPCTIDFPNMHCGPETTRIPIADSNTEKIQRIYLRNCPKLIFHEDDFVGYKNLTELYISSVSMTGQNVHIPLNKFVNLVKLKYLEFAGSGLTDQHMWIVPQGIETYNVSDNMYTYLNVSEASSLKSIVANKNQLKYLPIYSNPPPPLQTMNLLSNPLDKLTVEFLLPLCQLHQLQWNLVKNSHLNTAQGICDCLRLYKWMKKFNLQDFHIECQPLPDEMECDLSFGQVKFLRKHCSDAEKIQNSPPPPTFPFTIQPIESPATTAALPPPPTISISAPPPLTTESTSLATPSPATSSPTHPLVTSTPATPPPDEIPPTYQPGWERSSTLSVSPTAAGNLQLPTSSDTSLPGWLMFVLGSVVASGVWLSLAALAFVMVPTSSPSAVDEQAIEDE